MKLYLHYDIEALSKFLGYCATTDKDVIVTVKFSRKYGKSIVIESYYASLDLAKRISDCGLVEIKKSQKGVEV